MRSSRITLAATAVFFSLTTIIQASAGQPGSRAAVTPFCGDRYGACQDAESGGRTSFRTASGPKRAHSQRAAASRARPEAHEATQTLPAPSLGERTISGYADQPAPTPAPNVAVRRGLVTVDSAAGPITVAASFEHKIVPFIADVWARGFRGRVKCYARGGHVRGSLHYSGNACDFAQTGWGRTRAPMYHVSDLTNKYGLRNGCSFRDCGHIDSGMRLGARNYAARPHHRRYASR